MFRLRYFNFQQQLFNFSFCCFGSWHTALPANSRMLKISFLDRMFFKMSMFIHLFLLMSVVSFQYLSKKKKISSEDCPLCLIFFAPLSYRVFVMIDDFVQMTT